MKKLITTIITITMFFVMFVAKVTLASENNSIILESDIKNLKQGEEILITVKCENVADNGIQILTGKLEYDKSILEIVKNEDGISGVVESKNDWTTDISAENATFSSNSMNSKNGEIFSVKMKVLKNAESAKITATNLSIVNENYESKELKSNELVIGNEKQNKSNIVVIICIIILAVIVIASMVILKNKKSK
ncbi:MAG: hypothetical protein J6A89_04575 [Clostridia bacterium]|nr:hypothetical protein [Clostridia bacterium]